jgi:hypothetical protein
MHLVMIGGSDAGISAALRARELDPAAGVTVVVADAYPNFSICGLPYYVSGEVTHWRNLAHRTTADLEATGMRLRLDTTARRIDVPGRKLLVAAPDGSRAASPGRTPSAAPANTPAASAPRSSRSSTTPRSRQSSPSRLPPASRTTPSWPGWPPPSAPGSAWPFPRACPTPGT